MTRTPPARDDGYGYDDREFDPIEEIGEEEDEPQFRRAQKRVSVRKGPVDKKTAARVRRAAVALVILAALLAGYAAVERFAERSPRFRFQSSDNIEVQGNEHVSRAQVLDVMGADIGRNLFKIPLEERRRQLEEIPWVESAAVMRLLPDRIRVHLRERTPVAFVRIGKKVSLIDSGGAVMDLPARPGEQYSFPVITGMTDSDPLSTRAARMRIYRQLVQELDAGGANYSRDLSEVELSDPDDVKVTVEDPAGAVTIHLGPGEFLERYKVYVAHIQEWRQQFDKIDSVDLRYSGQIIINPDSRPARAAPAGESGKPAGAKKAS